MMGHAGNASTELAMTVQSKAKRSKVSMTYFPPLREGLGFVTSHLVSTFGEMPPLSTCDSYQNIPPARS